MSAQPEILTSVPVELSERIRRAYSIAVVVGAGASVPSGLPAFRGPRQMKYFENYPPAYICSSELLAREPLIFWRFCRHYHDLIEQAEPNQAHLSLIEWQRAALRRRVIRLSLITTNFDNLLERAAEQLEVNANLCRLYGNLSQSRCRQCGKTGLLTELLSSFSIDQLPPNCDCGGLVLPDIVLLSQEVERARYDQACAVVRGCEVIIFIGTSGVHAQTVNLAYQAKSHRALIVEVNLQSSYLTPHAQYLLRGDAAELLGQFRYCE